MIQLTNLTKTYDQKPVLHVPGLNIERGIYWLQGINGSGKTTFLKILAGLIPFEGDIRLNGIDLIKDPLCYRRLVNFADAEPLYPDFISGAELIQFYKDIRKASSDQTDMLTYLFKMNEAVSQPVKTYSSGMLKKLSLILAFIGKPALILLDEPLATMDEDTQHVIPDLLGAYASEFKSCVIFSSHQMFRPGALRLNKLLVSDHTLQLIA